MLFFIHYFSSSYIFLSQWNKNEFVSKNALVPPLRTIERTTVDRSLTNGRGSWVVGRAYKSRVVGVCVGVRVSNITN